MPTERFRNLSAEKQQTIRDAAIREYTRVSFDKVSINRIIKDAGISRGSFYTYFQDKWDLLEYLMDNTRRQIVVKINQEVDETHADYWEMLRIAMRVLLSTCKDETIWKFLINVRKSIGPTELLVSNPGPVCRWFAQPVSEEEALETFHRYTRGRYSLSPPEIFGLFQLAIFAIGYGLVERLSGMSDEDVMKRFEIKIDILKNGIESHQKLDEEKER